VMVGRTVSHYTILEKLGGGGMGVVYKAQDLKLDRLVALKFLPHEFGSEEEQKKRFIQEAKAASALDHPNICTVHEIDQADDGQMFIVMACYEGETLKKKIGRGPLPVKEAIDIAIQVAQGLVKAHEKGLIHRDIKPANLMMTDDGIVKIVDFGLAKEIGAVDVTRTMQTAGTAAYMSPEQVQGLHLDGRTDIWSLGVTLYEMLAGQRPFPGDTLAMVVHSIVVEQPKPLRGIKPEIEAELEQIVGKALAKDRQTRYRSAAELLKDLADYRTTLTASQSFDLKFFRRQSRRPKVVVPALLILLVLAGLVSWSLYRNSKARWAREQALPGITRLIEKGDTLAAFTLAGEAEKYISGESSLKNLWPGMSTRISVQTEPPGVEVYFKNYADVKGEWRRLGSSPLDNLRMPLGFFRWKLSKQGFATLEASGEVYPQRKTISFTLNKEGSSPVASVRVPGQTFTTALAGIGILGPVQLGDYWIDKYEVTNRQFKEFVDRGGYQKPEYWKNEFSKDGRPLLLYQALAEFRDTTGRPGPATWEAGSYPAGKEDFPVTGVSWYEAAAYAEFAGKKLPSIYDWYRAAAIWEAPETVPLSNFKGEGPAAVGTYQGVGPFGTYDMAGNVKEWCWNEESGRRYILGGGWNDAPYMFSWAQPLSPFDRSPANGFRCVKYAAEPSDALTLAVPREFRDYSKEQPVSSALFDVYKGLYSYDRRELHPKSEAVNDGSQVWRREKVTFDAAYGGERVIAHLFLPKDTPGPYQTVIFFPGAGTENWPSNEDIWGLRELDFIIKSGRALLYPIYKGTYERSFARFSGEPTAIRDRLVQWRKDLGTSIDYLESRKDIDSSKLAYCGYSLGARIAPVLLANEPRLNAAVLFDGGFTLGRVIADMPRPLPDPGMPLPGPARPLPEADGINFAPRVKMPVLMLNGRYDFIFPVEASQIPMFQFLGSAAKDKRHVVFETGHGTLPSLTFRASVIRETLDWLDHYLGPVH
jgi:serine/threonine protein kinase/pimeloyl-ACP methyl ester carboxylesterase